MNWQFWRLGNVDSMSESEQSAASFPSDRRQFATTRWSVVLAAGRESSAESEAALATLCETYWYPLYAYVRRQGHDSAEAQDLTQGFFTRLLEKELSATSSTRAGQVSLFPAGFSEALHHQRVGPGPGRKAWRRPEASPRRLRGRRESLSPGTGRRGNARIDFREAVGPGTVG